jgi:hypothetical protein
VQWRRKSESGKDSGGGGRKLGAEGKGVRESSKFVEEGAR